MATTTQDVVEYILDHRGTKVFKGKTPEDIIHEVCQAISQNCFSFCLNSLGKLNGVVLGSVIPEQHVFFVTQALTTERGVLRALLHKFTQLYPAYDLEARRRGKIKRYNTNKFIHRVNNLTTKGII